jgi:hypothetical protein
MKTKKGQFKGQQVIAKGLSRDAARSLETELIEDGWRRGMPLLNERRSILPPNMVDPIPTPEIPAVTLLPSDYYD